MFEELQMQDDSRAPLPDPISPDIVNSTQVRSPVKTRRNSNLLLGCLVKHATLHTQRLIATLNRLIHHLSPLKNGFDGLMENAFCFLDFLLNSHDGICLTWILEAGQILEQRKRINRTQGWRFGKLTPWSLGKSSPPFEDLISGCVYFCRNSSRILERRKEAMCVG
jgi:hypothetical protein